MKKRLLFGAILFSIGCLFFYHFQTRGQPSAAPTPPEKTTAPRPRATTPFQSRDTLAAFQASDFYRTIVNNNLFRPLG